jgi:hypothetical protein
VRFEKGKNKRLAAYGSLEARTSANTDVSRGHFFFSCPRVGSKKQPTVYKDHCQHFFFLGGEIQTVTHSSCSIRYPIGPTCKAMTALRSWLLPLLAGDCHACITNEDGACWNVAYVHDYMSHYYFVLVCNIEI